MAAKFDKIFPDYQSCLIVKFYRYFMDHLCPKHQGLMTLVGFNKLTWVIVPEDFINIDIFLLIIKLRFWTGENMTPRTFSDDFYHTTAWWSLHALNDGQVRKLWIILWTTKPIMVTLELDEKRGNGENRRHKRLLYYWRQNTAISVRKLPFSFRS